MSKILSSLPKEELTSMPYSLLRHGPASFAWSEAQVDARGKMSKPDPLRILQGSLISIDFSLIIIFSLLSYTFRHGIAHIPREIVTTSILAGLLSVNALSISNAYSIHVRDDFISQSWRAVRAWTFIFVCLLTIGYFSKILEDYSRIWAILWYFLVSFGLITVRFFIVIKLRRWSKGGRLASTVAIVDFSGKSSQIVRRLTENQLHEVRILGVFYPDTNDCSQSGITELIALSRLFRVDEIVILVKDQYSTSSNMELPLVLRKLGAIPTNVRICLLLPDLGEIPIQGTTLIHDIPMLTVHLRPLGGWSIVAKRIEDLLLGSLALFIMWPLLLAVAIAIKIDSPGPVLFRQSRQGFNNNVFTVLKFRSMIHQEELPGSDIVQATKNDSRVTKVGRILRRTSLDELPQIFNVITGEMSLVGPRPHAIVHNEQYSVLIDDYLSRHRVQPGITGWAQVNKLRGETDTLDKMQKRIEFDLEYIKNWSIGLDLKIIILTAFSVLFDRQAY